MVKKKMSMLLAAVLVASGAAVAAPAKAADVKPTVTYVAPARTMIETDNKMEFVVQASVKDAVEYRVHVQNIESGKWYELTDGYQKSEVGTNTFKPTTVKALPKGSYKASIWVRKVGSEANYDSYRVTNFKIQEPGYFDSRANMDELGLKDTYKVGEKVTIKGNDQYKLHIFDPSVAVRKEGWMVDKTYEAAQETTYTFEQPGVYLVDVWGKKADSKNQYDGWVLKVVTVTEKEEVKGIALETSVEEAKFGATVNVKCEYPGATKYQVFDGEKAISAKEGVELGTATTIFPAKKAGEAVTVKLLDNNGTVLVSKEVKLGETASIEAPKEEEMNVTATVKKATFGATVTVNCDNEKAVKYQIFDGEKAISAKEGTKIGESTTVFPAKKAGEKVTVKVLNDKNTVIKTVEVELTEAK